MKTINQMTLKEVVARASEITKDSPTTPVIFEDKFSNVTTLAVIAAIVVVGYLLYKGIGDLAGAIPKVSIPGIPKISFPTGAALGIGGPPGNTWNNQPIVTAPPTSTDLGNGFSRLNNAPVNYQSVITNSLLNDVLQGSIGGPPGNAWNNQPIYPISYKGQTLPIPNYGNLLLNSGYNDIAQTVGAFNNWLGGFSGNKGSGAGINPSYYTKTTPVIFK